MDSVSPDKYDHKQLTRYLLGEMSEAEQMQIEARYFADPQMFAELCSWRDHLIDSYVAGEVSPSLRARFEAGIEKSWAMNERIRFAETLQEAVDARGTSPVSRRHPAPGSVPAFIASHRVTILAGALLMILGAVWIVIRIRHQQAAANNEEDSSQTSSPAPLSSDRGASRSPELAQTSPPLTSKPVLLVTLSPNVARSASDATREIPVPQDTVIVHLLLTVDRPQSVDYHGVLTTLEGIKVLESGQLKAHENGAGRAVELFVPANLLPDGDYVVRLNSVAADQKSAGAEDYYFRVRKH